MDRYCEKCTKHVLTLYVQCSTHAYYCLKENINTWSHRQKVDNISNKFIRYVNTVKVQACRVDQGMFRNVSKGEDLQIKNNKFAENGVYWLQKA